MKRELPRVFRTCPIAHRGLHNVEEGRPENSRAAIKAAIDLGYGIEIDIQRSQDDAALVFHDYDLARLTEGTGAVNELTAKEASALRLKGSDEGIPALAEVLVIVDGRAPLLIEIKDQDGEMGPGIGPLEAAVAKAVGAYAGPVAVMSFNPHSIVRMADLRPDIPRGLVTSSFRAVDWDLPEPVCARLRGIPDFERTSSCFISHEWKDLSRPRVAELKADGNVILCWTVRSPEEEAEARFIADNITFENYLAAHPS